MPSPASPPSRRRWDDQDHVRSRSPPRRSESPSRDTRNDRSDATSIVAVPVKSVQDAKREAQQAAERLAIKLRARGSIESSGGGADGRLGGLVAVSHSSTSNSAKNDDFVKEIEINDLKNRYLLTKGDVQKQIAEETNAIIITRGRYYPNKALATQKDPPLYLHVSAKTQEALDLANERIDKLIADAMLPREDSFHQNTHASGGDPPTSESGAPGAPPPHRGRIWPSISIPVDIPSSHSFPVRAKIVGPQGSYVKHIQQVTGSRVQLKGRGSGFSEFPGGPKEEEKDMYIEIRAPEEEQVESAKELVLDLIKTVKVEYERFSSQSNSRGSYQQGSHNGNRYDGHRNDRGPESHPHGYQHQLPPPETDYSAYYAPPPPASGPGLESAGQKGTYDSMSSNQSSSTDQAALDYQAYYAAYYQQQFGIPPSTL